jgi:transposase InsO family protein
MRWHISTDSGERWLDAGVEAQTVITDWRTIYNHRRPHSSLSAGDRRRPAASLTTNKSEKPARLS